MKHLNRRTAPKVRDGQVQRKNRWARTPDYMTTAMPSLVIDRRRPDAGYRHVVRPMEVRWFVELLPHWSELRVGLNAIVLDGGKQDCMGWHRPGVVGICAWENEIEWYECKKEFHREHAEVFEKLAIPVDIDWDGKTVVRFTEDSAKAFLLIHVLVHELGHHHNRITTKSKRETCRGEGYAEAFARRYEDEIIAIYQREFGY
jgi:hypothetical protein